MTAKRKRAAAKPRRAAPAGSKAKRPPAAVAPPGAGRRARSGRKAVEDAPATYYLTGESTLAAATVPARPTAAGPTAARVTHDNSYGPVRGAVSVRVGNPAAPLGPDDFDTVPDWTPTVLVEELVWRDRHGAWVAAPRRVAGEAPWRATYEAELRLPRGRHRIEIKFASPDPDAVCSVVLSDREVRVR